MTRAWPRRRGRARGAPPEEEVVRLFLPLRPLLAPRARRGAAVAAAASPSLLLFPSMCPGAVAPLPQAAAYSGVYGSNGRTPQSGE